MLLKKLPEVTNIHLRIFRRFPKIFACRRKAKPSYSYPTQPIKKGILLNKKLSSFSTSLSIQRWIIPIHWTGFTSGSRPQRFSKRKSKSLSNQKTRMRLSPRQKMKWFSPLQKCLSTWTINRELLMRRFASEQATWASMGNPFQTAFIQKW